MRIAPVVVSILFAALLIGSAAFNCRTVPPPSRPIAKQECRSRGSTASLACYSSERRASSSACGGRLPDSSRRSDWSPTSHSRSAFTCGRTTVRMRSPRPSLLFSPPRWSRYTLCRPDRLGSVCSAPPRAADYIPQDGHGDGPASQGRQALRGWPTVVDSGGRVHRVVRDPCCVQGNPATFAGCASCRGAWLVPRSGEDPALMRYFDGNRWTDETRSRRA